MIFNYDWELDAAGDLQSSFRPDIDDFVISPIWLDDDLCNGIGFDKDTYNLFGDLARVKPQIAQAATETGNQNSLRSGFCYSQKVRKGDSLPPTGKPKTTKAMEVSGRKNTAVAPTNSRSSLLHRATTLCSNEFKKTYLKFDLPEIKNDEHISCVPIESQSKTNQKKVPVATYTFFHNYCKNPNKKTKRKTPAAQKTLDSEKEVVAETAAESTKPGIHRCSTGGELTNSLPELQELQPKTTVTAAASSSQGLPRSGLDVGTPKMPSCNATDGDGVGSNASFRGCNQQVTKPYVWEFQYKTRFESAKVAQKSEDKKENTELMGLTDKIRQRKRRTDMKYAFEELRKLIPATAENKKTSKVSILTHAVDFCKAVTRNGSRNDRERTSGQFKTESAVEETFWRRGVATISSPPGNPVDSAQFSSG